ncbi:hypothetical protein, partial [Actinoplanes awajinensis]
RAASTPAEQIQDALQLQHANGTHVPGTDAGCLNCQTACFCNTGFECVRCALEHKAEPTSGKDCLLCGEPDGYPYCTYSADTWISCAALAEADRLAAEAASADEDVVAQSSDVRSKCPICRSTDPEIAGVLRDRDEVQYCDDEWHYRTTEGW